MLPEAQALERNALLRAVAHTGPARMAPYSTAANMEDLVRCARQQQFQRVIAYLAVRNPRCERLLRKFGFEIPGWSYLEEERSAVLFLRRVPELPNPYTVAVRYGGDRAAESVQWLR